MDICDDSAKIEKIVRNELNSIKYKAFGKITFNKTVIPTVSNLVPGCDEQSTAPPPSNNSLLSKQSDLFKEKIMKLKETKSVKGKAAAVFQLRDDVLGGKDSSSEPSVMTDPCSKKMIHSPEEIKSVSLRYCKNLLTNRPAREPYEEDLAMKDMLHYHHLNEIVANDYEHLTVDQFEETLSTLLKKKPTKYEFILRGGPALKRAVFHLFQVAWSTEVIPSTWHKSTLIQLFKGKGERTSLENFRHIHIKEDIPKMFGHLVMSAARDKLFSSMSKFQIGAKPGHRPQEHLFVLKSLIALELQSNNTFFLSLYDISTFFAR